MGVGGLVIPVTVDDLAANGLLVEADPQLCWERSIETLTARKDDIAGLAVASDERIEAYLLFDARGGDRDSGAALVVEDGGARLAQLLARLRAHGTGGLRFPKVHPAELSRSSWRRSVFVRPASIAATPHGAISVTGAGAVVGARASLLGPAKVFRDGVGVAAGLPPVEQGVSLHFAAHGVPDAVRHPESD